MHGGGGGGGDWHTFVFGRGRKAPLTLVTVTLAKPSGTFLQICIIRFISVLTFTPVSMGLTEAEGHSHITKMKQNTVFSQVPSSQVQLL